MNKSKFLLPLIVGGLYILYLIPSLRPDIRPVIRSVGQFIANLFPDEKTAPTDLKERPQIQFSEFPKDRYLVPRPLSPSVDMAQGAIGKLKKLNTESVAKGFEAPLTRFDSAKLLHSAIETLKTLDSESLAKTLLDSLTNLDTSEPTVVIPAEPSLLLSFNQLDCEVRLNRIVKFHSDEHYEEGMKEADEFLAMLDKTANAPPEYKIGTAGLALQMAAAVGQMERLKHYGEIAMIASHQHGNYLLMQIEASYFEAMGAKVDFTHLQKIIKQFCLDFDSEPAKDLLRQANQLMTDTACLPPTSFYRLRARFFEAAAMRVAESDPFDDIQRFVEITMTAESAGDQVMADSCIAVVTEISGSLKTLFEALPRESTDPIK